MPRRSSKTSHVLNLLSGSEEQADENTLEPNNEPEEEIPPQQPKSFKPVEPAPSISIIDTADKGEDPLAQLIYNNLTSALEEDAMNSNPSDISEKAARSGAHPVAAAAPREDAEPEKLKSAVKSDSSAAGPSSADQAQPPVQTGSAKAAPEKAEAPPPADAKPEPDYEYVNVMEHVVQEKVIYFMNEFKMCTCDRCRADTVALALTNLPAKYIVVDKMAVSPLLNFYTNKYISHATVELTKACMAIKDNPRH